MKRKTANFISMGSILAATLSFIAAAGCYYGVLCKPEHAGNSGIYIHIVGLGMLCGFIAILPRFATLVFNIADRRVISQQSAVRLNNWLVIDELRRKNKNG